MAKLLKQIEHPKFVPLFEGPNERSVVVCEPDGDATYDFDLERSGDLVPATSCRDSGLSVASLPYCARADELGRRRATG